LSSGRSLASSAPMPAGVTQRASPAPAAAGSPACRTEPWFGNRTSATQAPAVTSRSSMPWYIDFHSLPVESVEASSSAGPNTAGLTVDNDLRSRWAPSADGSQWITYDLGKVQQVAGVSMVWFPGVSATPYVVETSRDGSRFSPVYRGRIEGRGSVETQCRFLTAEARYVRVSVDVADGASAPSLCEAGILESGVCSR
jgi:hypothetical protein